jgi:hypothetical protein
MKKPATAFLLGIAICAFFAFKSVKYDLRSNTAEVEQLEGLYIFTDSKPVKEYDFIGSEKVSFTLGSEQYGAIRNKLIKKVKKEYPQANAIIFHFENGGTDKADAIKLK